MVLTVVKEIHEIYAKKTQFKAHYKKNNLIPKEKQFFNINSAT